MEIQRTKNVASIVMFPFISEADAPEYFTGTVWGSLTSEAITAYSWSDGEVPSVHTLAGTPTEMGTSGEWYLSISQSEMNPDSGSDDYILIKFNADEIQEQTILLRLKAGIGIETIDSNVDTIVTDTGTTIPNQISGLNNVSEAEVNAQCDQALSDYDGPTRTEATSDKAEIIVEVDANETKIDLLQVDSTAIKGNTDNLPSGIKKNTALANFGFGMVDSTDNVTPKTGLTVTATRSIDGSVFGSCTNAVSEISNGAYKITLSADDLNGDTIILKFNADGADDLQIYIKTDT